MKTPFKIALAATALALAAQAAAQVTVFPREGFRGPATVFERGARDFQRQGFRADTASVVVAGGNWEVCDGAGFRGNCMVLQPGRYPTLASTGLRSNMVSARRYDSTRPAVALNSATLYDAARFRGRAVTAVGAIASLDDLGFDNSASSLIIAGGHWEVCGGADFRGTCVVLPPGRYDTLERMDGRVSSLRPVAALSNVPPAPVAAGRPAEIVLYDAEGFGGRAFSTRDNVDNLTRQGFNDVASSISVRGGSWEVCSDARSDGGSNDRANDRSNGRCVTLRPGQYPSLASMALNDRISSLRQVDDGQPAAPVAPVAVFYEQDNLRGRSFTAQESLWNLDRQGLQQRASSVDVRSGSWDVCEDPRFGGRCTTLQPGRYPSVAAMGLSDRVASTRTLGADGRMLGGLEDRARDARDRGNMQPLYDPRRRANEQLFEARVTAVREVVGPENQRCWVDRNPQAQAQAERGRPSVGGLIAGAVIGGILGHQVGGGSGKDLATIGGAVAGAAVGANVGRERGPGPEPQQDIARCTDAQVRGGPHFWDVRYNFRGVDHHVQMSEPPGDTVTVNADGEPRV